MSSSNAIGGSPLTATAATMATPPSSAILIKENAYCKMILHAIKYPHCAVNGILLAEKKSNRTANIIVNVVDCVPLFHVGIGLTPMVEVALTQIDYYCKERCLIIAGYYQANVNVNDNTHDYFARRIADKIHENYNDAILIMIDNGKLSPEYQEVAPFNIYTFVDGKWKLKDKSNVLEKERKSLATLTSLVQSKSHRTLIDFDNHLDNVALSWQNLSLNEQISTLV